MKSCTWPIPGSFTKEDAEEYFSNMLNVSKKCFSVDLDEEIPCSVFHEITGYNEFEWSATWKMCTLTASDKILSRYIELLSKYFELKSKQ